MAVERYAAIDIGTNSVLLLIAEKNAANAFSPLLELAEISRLGRGVDAEKRLSEEGIKETLSVLRTFCSRAIGLDVSGLVMTATSAVRDATNRDLFLKRVYEATGHSIEVLSGESEAALTYAAIAGGRSSNPAVVDIGGGSTEIIFGPAKDQSFRRSFNIGAVRLTERFVKNDPLSKDEVDSMVQYIRETLGSLPSPPTGSEVIAVAGTATTLYALQNRIDPYDAALVEGGTLSLEQISKLARRLVGMKLAERLRLPGLQPKRADVICAGALILQTTLEQLGVTACKVSDRGLRWGVMADRFAH